MVTADAPNPRSRRSSRHREAGVAFVEFAILLPFLSIMCLGVVDLARAYRLQVQLTNAARQGAEFGQNAPHSQQPNGSSCADPYNIRYQSYAEAGTTNVTVVVTPTESGGCNGTGPTIPPGCPIKVSVSRQFVPITPLLGAIIGSPIVHGTVTIRTQGQIPASATCPST